MGLEMYGVLKGFVVDTKIGMGSSPHYEIRVVDKNDDWRVAVNVKSQGSPSEVLYFVDPYFRHPICDQLSTLDLGFTSSRKTPEVGLDYIRTNLFNVNDMKPLPYNIPGPDNDLNELVDKYIQRANNDESAIIYAFGEQWPETNERDKYFGFKPQKGVHDIHMNQGNSGKWMRDNGVHQDGALLIYFASTKQWVAVFLAFQSQTFHTDDQTGNPITNTVPKPIFLSNEPPVPAHIEAPDIVISGALINPVHDYVGREKVYLFNRSVQKIDLSGWTIVDTEENRSLLNGITIDPMSCLQVELDGKGALLDAKGGIISLLDRSGIKHHGVSYTKKDAIEEKVHLFRI
jgi:uncharacterized protein YukJ